MDVFHIHVRLLNPAYRVRSPFAVARLLTRGVASTSFVLFLVFFRYDTSNVREEELGGEAPRWQTALIVGSLTLLHGLVVVVVTAVLGTIAPQHLSLWANILGLVAAALATLQYLPQIWTTYHLKHVGSLSIPMMCMQTPGGFVFAASLFARLGWGGWSSWGTYVMTASMQGVLLGMAIYYELHPQHDGPPKSPSQARSRLHANGFDEEDDDEPSRYSSHPEQSAEQRSRILHRQESDAAAETAPLLRRGGNGDPRRNYDTNQD